MGLSTVEVVVACLGNFGLLYVKNLWFSCSKIKSITDNILV